MVAVDGLVATPLRLDRSAWLALPRTQETRTLPLRRGLERRPPRLGGRARRRPAERGRAPGRRAGFVTFHAHGGAYTDSLSLDEARAPETLLADRLDGAPLPPDHGGPLRLVMPSQLGYKNVKWVVRLELTARARAGLLGRHAATLPRRRCAGSSAAAAASPAGPQSALDAADQLGDGLLAVAVEHAHVVFEEERVLDAGEAGAARRA